MTALRDKLAGLPGQRIGDLTVEAADDFAYNDPVDGSVTARQGVRILFREDARVCSASRHRHGRGDLAGLSLERFSKDRLDAPTPRCWRRSSRRRKRSRDRPAYRPDRAVCGDVRGTRRGLNPPPQRGEVQGARRAHTAPLLPRRRDARPLVIQKVEPRGRHHRAADHRPAVGQWPKTRTPSSTAQSMVAKAKGASVEAGARRWPGSGASARARRRSRPRRCRTRSRARPASPTGTAGPARSAPSRRARYRTSSSRADRGRRASASPRCRPR